jgi:hypothetical protein
VRQPDKETIMAFIERSDDKGSSYNDILRTAPAWLVAEVSEMRMQNSLPPLPFKGIPNDQGTPEQLDANLHALTLRKLEMLKEEANAVR